MISLCKLKNNIIYILSKRPVSILMQQDDLRETNYFSSKGLVCCATNHCNLQAEGYGNE